MSRERLTIITALLLAACGSKDQPAAQRAVGAASEAREARGDETAPVKQDVDASAKDGALHGTYAELAPGTFDNLSSCLRYCELARLLPTDRPICRYKCGNAYQPEPNAPGADEPRDPIADAVGCLGRCYTSGAAPDTCTPSCKTVAAAVPGGPSAEVLDRLVTCVAPCHADKGALPAARATCELNCAQEARAGRPAQP